ncbi:hypothetical protein BCR33DRAFT_779567 [Rhizoclosmatium globosum]|uniref:Uncharacterized protein n=1 Tax=Rhizoclosmatium globosum TaxID=329046 RepID=A0A1Y2D2A5_9FUNG|nr:hypothetical protein BCR33DRAFT_779567 [Rhizoclosmatium globosum]|eukprot:ORY53254.1 hypothetical protein BCR33DRAFT_779567 [Rhizoclosmatium globosum]
MLLRKLTKALPPFPSWAEFKDAEPIPSSALLHPSMPSDPSFLNLPVKDLFQRYLLIHPLLQLLNLVVGSGFFTLWDWNYATAHQVSDLIASFLFSLFGYISFYRMIPEWITVLGYFLLVRFIVAFGVKVVFMYDIGQAATVTVDSSLMLVVIILIFIIVAMSLAMNFIAFRIVFRIESWARECRLAWRRGLVHEPECDDSNNNNGEDDIPLIVCT